MDNLLVGAFALVFGAMIGLCIGSKMMQDRAIEANVAEWRIDGKTGEKEFVFLTKEEMK